MNPGRLRSWLQLCGIIGLLASAPLPTAAQEFPLTQWDSWRQQASERCPQDVWLTYATPEEAGWSAEKLQLAKDYYDEIGSAAVFVVHDGAVLAAWGDIETRFMCHSMRKSLLSALYGIHVASGTIDLHKTLSELGIDDQPPLTDGEKQARVIDLLTARSGVYHPAAYETAKMKEQRPPRGSRAPGEIFWYNNWDFNALCTIFEQETGTKVFEEFQKQFALPLGMQDFRIHDNYYHLEPQHSQHPAYPFRMSARDLARLGLLFLRNGKWRDRQILSGQWVHDSTSTTFRDSDSTANSQYAYGYLWWPIVDGPLKDLHMYSARGFGGHAIDVVPRANLVMVHRVDTFWDLALPVGREEKRVETAQRLELLQRILQARVSAPRPAAQLKPLPPIEPKVKPIVLARHMLESLAREYRFPGFTLSVVLRDQELFLCNPRIGEFKLLPLSQTRFVVEDLGANVIFALNEAGQPLQMTGEFAPGKEFVGSPVELAATTGR